MSTETPGTTQQTPPHPDSPEDPPKADDAGCQPCDLADFDGLACRAARYAKQAEIMTAVAADLEKYKKQYSEARVAFADAWEAVAAERVELEKRLGDIKKQLECRLTPEQKDCVDESAEDVFDDLDECGPAPGCCTGACEFDDTVDEGDDAAALTARIEKYRRDTEDNTACFLALVGEPNSITTAVQTLKTEVRSLATDIQGSDDAKLPRWYARLLIATRALGAVHLGHGFASVAAYSSCLCVTLRCIAEGWAAIAVLEGARAERACLETARKAECDRKAGAVLESILEAYECCVEDKSGDGTSEGPSGEADQAPTAS